MYGVSPAWFLSNYGEDFTCVQAAESLTALSSLGYEAWQPEIFLPERLKEWEQGGSSVLRSKCDDLNLSPSQFVAHFLLHSFGSADALLSNRGLAECEGLLSVLVDWPDIPVVTIPLPAFRTDGYFSSGEYARCYEALVEKLKLMVALIEKSGRRCGVEVMPGALVGGSEGVLRLRRFEGLENLGVNLDTGHFNASAEQTSLTLARIGDAVCGTHLCDNDGVINESLEPGAGTVDWAVFGEWASSGGYRGSWDIEIRCPVNEVHERYRRGLDFLSSLLEDENT